MSDPTISIERIRSIARYRAARIVNEHRPCWRWLWANDYRALERCIFDEIVDSHIELLTVRKTFNLRDDKTVKKTREKSRRAKK